MTRVSRIALFSAVVLLAAAMFFFAGVTKPVIAQNDAADAEEPGPFPKAVLTWHNDNLRTGRNPGEIILKPSNVNSTTFGKLFVIPTDGKVDAQTLFAPNITIPNNGTHNVLFVATEHGTVYAFDSDNGTKLWQMTTLQSGEIPSDDRSCGQVSPEIGVTSTPVIDLAAGPHGTMYVVAMSKVGTTYHQRLHALDITTGTEQFGGPVEVVAQYPGTGDNSKNGSVVFDAKQYKSRPGLLLLKHHVYTFWSSHCDFRPYTGWIISYDQNTLAQTSILNIVPNGNEGSIWQAGAGPAADSAGNIYFLVGNGTFDTTLDGNGFPNKGDFGNAVMKLSTKQNKLAVADYFTMFNTVSESNADEDLGSGGAMALPNIKDGNGVMHHLVVGAGKDTKIYLVNRDNMGKFNPNNDSAIYQELSGALAGSVFSSPAYFNKRIYYGAVGDTLRAFSFNSNGFLNSTAESFTSTHFGYPGTTPSISGSTIKNSIVWATENTAPAVLHAYNAMDLSKELYNSNQAANGRDHFGNGNKYITPTIANGKVYVGTANGVGVFGLLP
jgi:outer membrane protein assembly factor BamB